MARRTTVILAREDGEALRIAGKAEGLSQSELIRRGIALVTAPYRRTKPRTVGWLRLSQREIESLWRDDFGDRDT